MPTTDGAGDLQQGNLEQSNVEVGQRNLRPDRRAARLRDELQGDHRRRPDAVGNLQPDALRSCHDPHSHRRALALAALVAAADAQLRQLDAGAARAQGRKRPSPAISCASATSSRMPASSPRCRFSARPISAQPARCPPTPWSRRCARHALIGLDTAGMSEVG